MLSYLNTRDRGSLSDKLEKSVLKKFNINTEAVMYDGLTPQNLIWLQLDTPL